MKKIFKTFPITATLAAVMLLSACSHPLKPQADIIGSWSIKQVEGQVIGSEKAQMVFSPQEQINGHNGCNNLLGKYHLVDDHLNLTYLALTRRACQGQSAQDARLIDTALDKVEHFLIKDGHLFLTDEQDKRVMSLLRN